MNRMPQLTSTAVPAFQTSCAGPLGRTSLPLSPCFATPFGVKTASPGPWCATLVPPASPHASATGAWPGLRHGE